MLSQMLKVTSLFKTATTKTIYGHYVGLTCVSWHPQSGTGSFSAQMPLLMATNYAVRLWRRC